MAVQFSKAAEKISPGLLFSCVICLSFVLWGAAANATQRGPAAAGPAAKADTGKPAVEMTAIQTQVMLDRAGFSPGEIDGKIGPSTRRALEAYTKNGGKADELPADAV